MLCLSLSVWPRCQLLRFMQLGQRFLRLLYHPIKFFRCLSHLIAIVAQDKCVFSVYYDVMGPNRPAGFSPWRRFSQLFLCCMKKDAVIELIDSFKHTLNSFYCCLQTLNVDVNLIKVLLHMLMQHQVLLFCLLALTRGPGCWWMKGLEL